MAGWRNLCAGKGNPGWTLPDETFAVKHDEVGLIGLANNGEPHTAASQFYITLQPVPWLNGKRVVFGKVSGVRACVHCGEQKSRVVPLSTWTFVLVSVRTEQVVDRAGLELLRVVEQLPTNNERPLPEVTISDIKVLRATTAAA